MSDVQTKPRGAQGHSGGEEIEMTVFKDWGRRLPDGAAEIDREDMEEERELFAQFPDDWKTYQDAPGRTPITSEQERALREATDRMIKRARAMKADMEKRGEEVDFDKIEAAVFGHIPRGMIPPEWVKELQSWRRVRDAMNARAVVQGQAPEGRAEKVKGAVDKVKLGADLTKAALDAGKTLAPKEVADVVEKISQAFEYLGKAMELAGGYADVASAADKGQKAGKSPVEIKIADEKMLEALSGIAGLGIDLAGSVIPIISALKNGADCLAAVKDTVERTKLRAATGDLKDKAAVNTTDQLGRAFDQAQGRETRLAVESGVNATTSALGAAGDVVAMTGVGTAAGLGIKIANGVLTVGSKVVFTAVDEVGARKALETLKKAQGGDTQAQELVFNDHPHYAKMLIAQMAIDNNPLAKKYLIDRGLEEADLANPLTTGDILFDYMVMKSKEEDAPSSKIEAAGKLIEAAGEKLKALGALCEKALVRIGALTAKPTEPPPEMSAPVPTKQQIALLFKQLGEAREKLEEAKAAGGNYESEYKKFTFCMELIYGLQEKCNALAKQTAGAAEARQKWANDGKAPSPEVRANVLRQVAVLSEEHEAWQAALDSILRKGA